MRKQHHAFAAASVAVLLILAAVGPTFAAQGNNPPCLCGAKITPKSGQARTAYVAQVRYTDPDGDIPAKVEVYVDNIAYPMRLVKGRAAAGIYQAKLTLPPGEHTYYFSAEDIKGQTERFPRYGAKPGPFVGTNSVFNRLPVLTNGGVFFDYGPEGATYTFTVNYQDKDGTRPRAVRVVVDGIPHEMTLHKGNPADGIYLYQANLPAGPHAYYFTAADDCGGCVAHPGYGFLRGPEVDAVGNTAPVLLDGSVDPNIGGNRTPYTYSVEYRDIDRDPPAIARVYINGKPHEMKLRCGKACGGIYTYRARHCFGEWHNYYFYFEDGRGGATRLPEVGTLHGPVVTR